MTREQPTTNEHGEQTHPAYAMVGASRVTSSPGEFLFGSDFRHGSFVVISIHDATLRRDVAHDWHHAGRELIQIALSEAQWATFVSSMNVGFGVPATIQRLRGQIVPGLEGRTDRREQYRGEIDDRLREILDDLVVIRDEATSGRRRERVDSVIQQLRQNLPWIAEQFDEQAERTVERAKIEINAYTTQMIQRAGLASLAHDGLLELDDSEGGDR